jgi:hypothetical protein
MDRSGLLRSLIAVAAVGNAGAQPSCVPPERHRREWSSIGPRAQRRASSLAYRIMERVVVADRSAHAPLESQVTASSSW